jgi:threonine dehydrogenase-like Zn-dependent dehydrogenase
VLVRPGEIAIQERPIPMPAPRDVEVTSVGVAISDVHEHRLSAAERMGASRVLRAGDDAPASWMP